MITQMPPSVEIEPYEPTLAERNAAWDQLCSEIDCSMLPMGFFTVDLNQASRNARLPHGTRLQIPLNDKGVPLVQGWGNPVTAANVDSEGRKLRQYYSGFRFEFLCCDRDLLDAFGIKGEWPDIGLVKFVELRTAPSAQNFLGWHLHRRSSSATDRVMNPQLPPTEFLEDFDEQFWRVTKRYGSNGRPIGRPQQFLSKSPLIAGRYIYAQCDSAGCSFHTLEDRGDKYTAPHVKFMYSETFRMEKSVCADASTIQNCDPIVETMSRITQATKILDAVVNALLAPR